MEPIMRCLFLLSPADLLHPSNNWRGSTKWLLHVVWIVRLFICLQIEHLVNLGARRDDVWKLLLKKCRICRIEGHFIERILYIVMGNNMRFPDKGISWSPSDSS